MNIVICDDIPEALDALESAIYKCPYFQNIEIEITRFESGVDFLKALQEGMTIDFIFIDVRMPEVSGIDVVNALPSNCDALIIYVTSYTENWADTRAHFESGYLVKPYTQETFNKTVEVVSGRKSNAHFYEYTARDKDISVSFIYKRETIICNRIIYFTVSGHEVEMHIIDGKKRLSGVRIKNISDELMNHGFFLCHRSFLINLRYYHDRNNNNVVLMANGGAISVPLSRNRITALEDAVLDYKTRGKYAF